MNKNKYTSTNNQQYNNEQKRNIFAPRQQNVEFIDRNFSYNNVDQNLEKGIPLNQTNESKQNYDTLKAEVNDLKKLMTNFMDFQTRLLDRNLYLPQQVDLKPTPYWRM